MGRISKKGKLIKCLKRPQGAKARVVRKTKREDESESSESDFEDEFEDDETKEAKPGRRTATPKFQVKKPKAGKEIRVKDQRKEQAAEEAESSSDGSDVDMEKHKEIVRSLRQKDPDFYQYLQEHDKELLDFYEKVDDGVEDGEEKDETDTTATTHETETVTMSHINKFRKELQHKPSLRCVTDTVALFRAAVMQAEGNEEARATGRRARFVAEGQTVFNAIVRLCLSDFLPAVHKVLSLPPPVIPQDDGGKGMHLDPTRSHHWRKLLVPMKSYLSDIVTLTAAITDPKLVAVLLKHVLFLVPYYTALPQASKALHKRLVTHWCEGEETIRILAFLCLFRTVRRLPKPYLNALLKHMYISYVRNSKFTSPSTWPQIAFMRRSLVEMYALDQAMAYQHAFLYIRQLAIHLRNAMTVKKKDTCKAVYNWQYVHCCLLWLHLLSTLYPSETVEPLIYPLVQTVTGTIQLIPAAKYIPLRFHLIRGLIQLTTSTRTFVPIMPHLLEVFTIVNFDRKHTAVSMRPVDFRSMLRASESQMKENGFRDAVVEGFYDLALQYLAGYSSSIAFPELTLPAVVRLKAWLKKCRVANYIQRIRQLLEKIEENSKFIEKRRKNVTAKLSDAQALDLLEAKWKDEGTPLAKFYEQWEKLRGEREAVAKRGKVLTELPESETDSEDERRKKKGKKIKQKEMKSKKRRVMKDSDADEPVGGDEDVVQDIVLSSSEYEDEDSDADESD